MRSYDMEQMIGQCEALGFVHLPNMLVFAFAAKWPAGQKRNRPGFGGKTT